MKTKPTSRRKAKSLGRSTIPGKWIFSEDVTMKTKKKSLGQVAYEAYVLRDTKGWDTWMPTVGKNEWHRVARAVVAAHKGRKKA